MGHACATASRPPTPTLPHKGGGSSGGRAWPPESQTAFFEDGLFGRGRKSTVESFGVRRVREAVSNECITRFDLPVHVECAGATFEELNYFLLDGLIKALNRRNEIDVVFGAGFRSPLSIPICSCFVLKVNRSVSMSDDEFPFKVVRTNGHEEVLARSVNLLIGRAAFEFAKRLFPKDRLEYRRGAQVLDKSGGDES
jgi:hypothetical protein